MGERGIAEVMGGEMSAATAHPKFLWHEDNFYSITVGYVVVDYHASD